MNVGVGNQILTKMLSDVCRYLNEESLEIQVWGGVVSRWTKSEAEGRPCAEDKLLGLAYVPLGKLLGHWDRSGPQIRWFIGPFLCEYPGMSEVLVCSPPSYLPPCFPSAGVTHSSSLGWTVWVARHYRWRSGRLCWK